MANETVFKRYEGNPIVTAKDLEGANSIFNSAIVPWGKEYVGVFRCDSQQRVMEIHLAHSKDGLKWNIEKQPLKFKNTSTKSRWGYYDPRVTKIGNTYYVTWCYYPAAGPAIGIAKTKDFKSFYQITDIMLPYNRNGVLFPKKIGGKFACLHRPSDQGHTPFGQIFYATSPDLIHWGNHKLVMTPEQGWESTKIGAGPVPLEIKEGWLMIYHGVITSCNGMCYSAGGAILDRNEPWKVLYRSKRYLLSPTEIYETAGDVPNVVFPTTLLHDKKTDKLTMYYGAADTVIAIAHAQLDELVDFIKKNTAK